MNSLHQTQHKPFGLNMFHTLKRKPDSSKLVVALVEDIIKRNIYFKRIYHDNDEWWVPQPDGDIHINLYTTEQAKIVHGWITQESVTEIARTVLENAKTNR